MKIVVYVLLCLGFLNATWADTSERPAPPEFDLQSCFVSGQREIVVGGGIFFSPVIAIKGRPTENYAGGLCQFGYMLTDLKENGLWLGNLEGLVEVFAHGIFLGRGNYFAGSTFRLRYNMVIPSWKVSPYFQVGAGASLADFDHRIFGQAFNFNLDAAGGARYFLTSRFSLNAEYRFQHASNANLAKHNLGINAQGAVLSASWYF